MVLKIQSSDEGDAVRFMLSGRFELEHVAELQRLIDEAKHEDHAISLDLKEARVVSREAITFLGRCESSGIGIENCPVYVRESISRGRR